MTARKKICRVCGKTYDACRTQSLKNTFRWQDVSCSPECGEEYLRRVMLSRSKLTDDSNDNTENDIPVDEAVESSDIEDDEYGFDEDPDEDYLNGFGADTPDEMESDGDMVDVSAAHEEEQQNTEDAEDAEG